MPSESAGMSWGRQACSHWVQERPHRVQAGPHRVQAGPRRVQAHPSGVQEHSDKVQEHSRKVQARFTGNCNEFREFQGIKDMRTTQLYILILEM